METSTATVTSVMGTVSDALLAGLEEAAVGMIDVVAGMLPFGLSVCCGVMVISMGIKLFKKVTGR